MDAATAIKPSPRYKVEGTQLLEYDDMSDRALLPEGIESIADGAFTKWRQTEVRPPAIVFPDSFRELTWRQVGDLGEYALELPRSFLRRDLELSDEEIRQPLGRSNWEEKPVNIITAARVYLFKEEQWASRAQNLLHEFERGVAASIMVDILAMRARKKPVPERVLRRAVIFCVRYAEKIAADTVLDLVRLLPDGENEARRPFVTLPGHYYQYHPALLDYVLRMVHISPDDPAFREVRTVESGRTRKASPTAVKCAIVPYIAEGLNVDINDHADKWMRWPRYVFMADGFSENLTELGDVIEDIVPGIDGRPTQDTYDCAIAIGRFGNSDTVKELAYSLDLPNITERDVALVHTAFTVTSERRLLDLLEESSRFYITRARYYDTQIAAYWKELALRSYTGNEWKLRKSIDAGAEKWEVVVGPELSLKWRVEGEKKFHTYWEMEQMRDDRFASGDHAAAVQADRIVTLDQYLIELFNAVDHQLSTAYLTDGEFDPLIVGHMMRDNALRQAVCGVVWAQDGRTFTVSEHGAVDAAGQSYYIDPVSPVRIAYAPAMNAGDVDAWRRYFDDKPYDSWYGHMEEPDYSQQIIQPDRYNECEIRHSALRRKKMMSVLRVERGILNTESHMVDMHFYRRKGSALMNDIRVREMTRAANRILFQLDMATLEDRVKKDDTTILPLLDRAPRSLRRKALKAAQSSNALHLKAALLALTAADTSKKDKSRFSTAL